MYADSDIKLRWFADLGISLPLAVSARADSRASIASVIAGMIRTCLWWAFDVIELNGEISERDPLAVRKERFSGCWREPPRAIGGCFAAKIAGENRRVLSHDEICL